MPRKTLKSVKFQTKSSFLSGVFKNGHILPFMAGILVGMCICMVYLWQNQVVQENTSKNQPVLLPYSADEFAYANLDKKILQKPTVPPKKKVSNFHIKIPIVMYHYVENVEDPNDKMRKSLAITPQSFEAQLKMLKKENFKTYFVKELPDIIDQKTDVEASKSAVLTFDDGYEDFYTDAFPLLEKYQVKGTIYVINDLLDRKGYLTTAELEELAKSPYIEIGAHTLDHVYLKGVSEKNARRQILESKEELENLLKTPIKTFAYPFGAFDDQAVNIVKEASFSAAVSVIPGNVHSEDTKFYLYRIRAGAFLGPKGINNLERNYDEQPQ